MIIRLLLGIGVGALAGAVLGASRHCENGACPLTASPTRGALFGGILGIALALTLGGSPTPAPVMDSAVTPLEAVNSQSELDAVVTGEDRTVLAVFSAPWCPACHRFEPVLAQFAQERAVTTRVVKIDVDRAQGLASTFGVRYLPTTVVFRDGKEIERFVGGKSADELRALLTRD